MVCSLLVVGKQEISPLIVKRNVAVVMQSCVMGMMRADPGDSSAGCLQASGDPIHAGYQGAEQRAVGSTRVAPAFE